MKQMSGAWRATGELPTGTATRSSGHALRVAGCAPAPALFEAEVAINREVANDPFQMGQQQYASASTITPRTKEPVVMQQLQIIDIPNVGTIIESIHGGYNWAHLDGTTTANGLPPNHEWFQKPRRGGGQDWVPLDCTGPVDYFKVAYARASLLAYHLVKGLRS